MHYANSRIRVIGPCSSLLAVLVNELLCTRSIVSMEVFANAHSCGSACDGFY